MKEEDRKLLLKDLSARLPYFTKVQIKNEIVILDSICDDDGYYFNFIGDDREGVNIENIKPYLFPLSSMNEEQFNELKSYVNLKYEHNTLELVEWDNNYKTLEFWLEEIPSYHVIKVFDWLNKNHFDYRGLIPMGLANDATELNIY